MHSEFSVMCVSLYPVVPLLLKITVLVILQDRAIIAMVIFHLVRINFFHRALSQVSLVLANHINLHLRCPSANLALVCERHLILLPLVAHHNKLFISVIPTSHNVSEITEQALDHMPLVTYGVKSRFYP